MGMGGTRLMTLLTTPFPPLLRPSLIVLHRRLSTTTLRPLTIFSPSTTAKPHTQYQRAAATSFHSQPNNNTNNSTYALDPLPPEHHHPWPEWTHFLNILSSNGPPVDHRTPPEDAFVVYEELPDDFVHASAACLAFARAKPDLLGLLSRRDIEAVVSNGTPFLFKSALDAARRMRAFLGTDGTNASGVDKANTTDLMKYILSYVSNASASSERNGLYSRELVDSSIRNLLRELGAVSSGVPPSYVPASSHQLTGGYRQTPRPFGQNIEMKRGDWICAKCNFMNFARNTKCLECEESRPKKQLTGGEWECPQCNFYNYGRNSACLRCDCRRPGAPLFNSMPGSRYNIDNSNITNTDNRAPGNEERAQSWFNKISQLNNSTNINKSAPSQDLPESKPLTSDTENKEKVEAEKSERWFKKVAELHDIKDLASAVSDDDFPETMPMPKGEYRFVVSKKKDRSLTSPKYKRQVAMDQANNTNFVPFVPFPPGYFAKKDPEQTEGQDSPSNSVSESKVTTETEKIDDTSSSKTVPETTNYSRIDKNESVGSSWTGKSLEGSAVKETDPLDMSEEAKAERWFKRVAQIKDISELSQIPDEDFPSIMPMRKGVNRFVVSKRKTPLERRLTSQQYRRNLPIVSNEPLKKETDNS